MLTLDQLKDRLMANPKTSKLGAVIVFLGTAAGALAGDPKLAPYGQACAALAMVIGSVGLFISVDPPKP